ncbi:chymotrypsin family serine protease [Paenibacillus arenilitoris]|uniref:Serine protease n=1 Tax=Paenibacillus arenilitoris TaxID=2772299 RepID=A0A927CL79_9BACL|nr:hypothetical protein [Paenibacillus arenilitoris]MBD2867911.1 hypothetical protein [Paenibacillus arenilitoris]
MATFLEALQHKTKIAPALLKQAGVSAIGVGYASPDRPSRGAAVTVYMQKAMPTTALSGTVKALTGGGIPIRIIRSEPFRRHAEAAPSPLLVHQKKGRLSQSRIRPVPAGASIGTFGPPTTGTGGLVVTKNGALYLLSNNHVLVKANSPAYSETVQPGPADGGEKGVGRIGQAFEYVPLNPGGVNFMDAAIASPLKESLLNPRYLVSGTGRLATVPGYLNSFGIGEQFVKFGRTTGFASGTVESINVDVEIGPYGELNNAVLLFRNQTVIAGQAAVSLPGDSGGVWLRQSDRYAAALNFAGSGNRSISTPIAAVMQAFGVQVAVPAAGRAFKRGKAKGAVGSANYRFTRTLTTKQRKQVRVVRVKRRRRGPK